MILKTVLKKLRTYLWEYCVPLYDYCSQFNRFRKSNINLKIVSGGLRICRIDRELRLPEVREASRLAVISLFDMESIEWWTTRTFANQPSIFGTRAANRKRILSALKGSTHFSNWYWRPLTSAGRPSGPARIMSQLSVDAKIETIQLFEIVSPSKSSTFNASSVQGSEISFWKHDVFGTLVSPSDNLRLEEISSSSEFERSHAEAVLSSNADSLADVTFPIDVVYTWVDGSDAKWQSDKANSLQLEDSESFIQKAVDEARFADHDELRYSLRSIEQFAPWVRTIWIVSANQKPDWLNLANDRIRLVNHEDIWSSSEGLPNFNSHAIEANINKIKGLSRHFLYFNDDFILGRPVSPELFFHGNGITKFFESKALVNFSPISPLDNASTLAAKNARSIIQKEFGKVFSRKFFHAPSPIDREVLTAAEERLSIHFDSTKAARFRMKTDIAAVGSFYFNWAHAIGRAVPGKISYAYIDPATLQGRRAFAEAIKTRRFDALCINDGSTEESMEQRIETDLVIRMYLDEYLPVKSKFEI